MHTIGVSHQILRRNFGKSLLKSCTCSRHKRVQCRAIVHERELAYFCTPYNWWKNCQLRPSQKQSRNTAKLHDGKLAPDLIQPLLVVSRCPRETWREEARHGSAVEEFCCKDMLCRFPSNAVQNITGFWWKFAEALNILFMLKANTVAQPWITVAQVVLNSRWYGGGGAFWEVQLVSYCTAQLPSAWKSVLHHTLFPKIVQRVCVTQMRSGPKLVCSSKFFTALIISCFAPIYIHQFQINVSLSTGTINCVDTMETLVCSIVEEPY